MRHFGCAYRSTSWGCHPWAGPEPGSRTAGGSAASKPRPGGEPLCTGLFSIRSHFLLRPFCVAGPGKKNPFPRHPCSQSSGPGLCFPNSAPHPDWDLGIKLSGRETGLMTSICWHGQQWREHSSVVLGFLIRWLPADGSSVSDQDRHDESGGWELFLEIQQSLLLQSFR